MMTFGHLLEIMIIYKDYNYLFEFEKNWTSDCKRSFIEPMYLTG
jgi:hypothetical protein